MDTCTLYFFQVYASSIGIFFDVGNSSLPQVLSISPYLYVTRESKNVVGGRNERFKIRLIISAKTILKILRYNCIYTEAKIIQPDERSLLLAYSVGFKFTVHLFISYHFCFKILKIELLCHVCMLIPLMFFCYSPVYFSTFTYLKELFFTKKNINLQR